MISDRTITLFWGHVDRNGPVPAHRPRLGRCWVWTASKDRQGYGMFGMGKRTVKAHRFAFFLEHGHWPEPCGLHRCDNRACVRHIVQGTNADNVADRAAKGRHGVWLHPERLARGERSGSRLHPASRPRGEQLGKLTEQQVREIRAAVAGGETHAKVGARYGISRMHICKIANRQAWRHVP